MLWVRKESNSAAEPTTTSVATSPDGATTAPAAGPGAQAISIKDFSFTPASLSIEIGDSVTWTNADGAAHSIESGDRNFDSSDKIDSAKSFTFTFTTAGTYTYICGIHPYVKGTVEVAG